MSDMQVREITDETQAPAVVDLSAAEVEQMLRGSSSPKPGKVKRGEIVFEGPSEAQQKKDFGNEKASPLVDAAGRPRWIATRECWCSHTSNDECRFHHPSEPGWETCPSQNNHSEPRKLWATNPDFGKPRDIDEVLAEEQQVELEETA